jgi:hypothetical protein
MTKQWYHEVATFQIQKADLKHYVEKSHYLKKKKKKKKQLFYTVKDLGETTDYHMQSY